MKSTMKHLSKRFAGYVLFVLALLFISVPVFAKDTVTVSVKGKLEYKKAYEVLDRTNQLRAKVGAEPLSMDSELLAAAMQRAAETAIIFSHIRPDGYMCITASDKMSGENIAAGQGSAASVVTSWKNSSGHYENIINRNYQSVGIGCFNYNGTLYWTQCFGYDTASVSKKPSDKTAVIKIQLHKYYFQQGKGLYIYGNLKSIAKGKTNTIRLIFDSSESFKPVQLLWNDFILSSNHPEIISINKNGQIKAIKKGNASILVKHLDFPEWVGEIALTVTDPYSRNVILNANGGSLSKKSIIKKQTQTLTYNKKYGKLPVPVRKGYIFKGWYTKKSGGNKITDSKTVKIAKGKNQTLYAHWSKITVKKANISKLTSKGSTLTIKWKKISGIKGYELFLSKDKQFNEKATQKINLKNSAKIYTFKGLIKNVKYFCKLRAYKIDSLGNKIYGKFSSVKSIKIK